MSYSIGSLAKAGGVGVETIRYYQRRGLLQTPSSDGGMRRYDTEDLRRLRFIRQAQTAGFTSPRRDDSCPPSAIREDSHGRDLRLYVGRDRRRTMTGPRRFMVLEESADR